MLDYIKPVVRKKPDTVIFHTGSNDLTNDVKTMNTVKKLVQYIRENEKDNIQIRFSSTCYTADWDLEKEMNDPNGRLNNYCSGNGFIFVDNSTINESCLNKSKLYLNKKGTSILANNIKSSLKDVCWLLQSYTNKSDTTKTHFSDHSSIDCVLRELKNKNLSNIIFSYLNINSIRNKFENLREIIDGNVDVLCVAETKNDSSFPTGQFSLEGYHSLYRTDVSNKRGWLLV